MRHLEIARPAGRAQLERVPTGWSVDLEASSQEVAADLLGAAVHAVAADGGGLLRLWARAGDPVTVGAGEGLGFELERELLQLRLGLPVAEAWDLDVRAFVVGQDEAAWLGVNNRAFAWHPEQGGWTLADLQVRFAEPWFDPAGFLLHEEGGRLAGFCWTKEHRDVDPAMGEIYVIAVDPAAGGHGLGRALTLAGLAHLHSVGLEIGMLYVDGTNAGGPTALRPTRLHHAPRRPQLHPPGAVTVSTASTRFDLTRDELGTSWPASRGTGSTRCGRGSTNSSPRPAELTALPKALRAELARGPAPGADVGHRADE